MVLFELRFFRSSVLLFRITLSDWLIIFSKEVIIRNEYTINVYLLITWSAIREDYFILNFFRKTLSQRKLSAFTVHFTVHFQRNLSKLWWCSHLFGSFSKKFWFYTIFWLLLTWKHVLETWIGNIFTVFIPFYSKNYGFYHSFLSQNNLETWIGNVIRGITWKDNLET